MHKLSLIALGGMLGTLCRYGLAAWIEERARSQFPYGTVVINLAGCLVAGILFPLFEHASVSPELRLAVFTGFLGGFTTFSAYGLQTVVLADGLLWMAVLNVLVSNAGGLALVWIGINLSRALL
jgi:fluoride exporter